MPDNQFIFVIGFMASGKSTFGKKIAKELGFEFIDTDSYIEQEEGKSIEQIFEQSGEKYFRLLEKEALNEILDKKGNYVVSTGGGMACNQHRLNKMLKNGEVIYLEIDVKSVMYRLKQAKTKRPLLANLSEEELEKMITRLLKKRNRYYQQAHHTIPSLTAKKFDPIGLIK